MMNCLLDYLDDINEGLCHLDGTKRTKRRQKANSQFSRTREIMDKIWAKFEENTTGIEGSNLAAMRRKRLHDIHAVHPLHQIHPLHHDFVAADCLPPVV